MNIYVGNERTGFFACSMNRKWCHFLRCKKMVRKSCVFGG